jgi:hypothetical protein
MGSLVEPGMGPMILSHKGWLAVFAFSAAVLTPAIARPCIDIRTSTRYNDRLLAEAEKHLAEGRYSLVLRSLGEGRFSPRNVRQGERRMELVAIANIRGGDVRAGVKSLRYLLRKFKDDPYLLTRLAEGASKIEDARAEALGILENLEKADLIPDPQGYAILAELLSAHEDEAGAVAARLRCEKIAKDAEECRVSLHDPRPSFRLLPSDSAAGGRVSHAAR